MTEQPQKSIKLKRASKNLVDRKNMDMTPMVDVTFLLLIFFMVTASFTLIRSAESPQQSESSLQPVESIEGRTLVVAIDEFNTFHLMTPDDDYIECGSMNELRARMKGLAQDSSFQRLQIKHHGDAHHERVVAAWDAGISNNITDIVTHLNEVNF